MVREMKYTEIGEIPAEWKLRTFEETFRILSNNTLPRADLNNQGGTVRNVHYGDILTRFGEVLDCEKDEIPYLNDGALLTASAQVLQDGDVILADTAEDDTVGKATEVYGLGKGRMVAGLHTIPCRVKKGDFVPKWLGYYMNSPIYHNQVLPYITGIKVSSISKTAISETLIVVPPIEEQKVIVSALSEVDQLLVELKRIVSKLRDFKRGCLYLMFPQEGSDIPQMREPGYDEPWEQRKLGEVVAIKDSARIPNAEWSDFGVPYIRASDITNENTQGVLFITHERYEFYKNKTGAPVMGDVLFNGGGEIGKTLLKVDDKPIYVQGGAVLYAQTSVSKTLDGQYLKTYFENRRAKNYIDAASAGGTMKHFTLRPSQEMPVLLPAIEEQKQIGTFFLLLDHLISLHQQKYDKYTQIKKAMMSELITGKIKLV